MLKFSGEGADTNILLKPYTIAPAIPIPRAADFPRPLPAVRFSVDFKFFSDMAKTNQSYNCQRIVSLFASSRLWKLSWLCGLGPKFSFI